MRRFDQHRRLPAIAVFAALVASPFAVFAQAPVAGSVNSPASTPKGLPPLPPPTPEELGDSLMTHQRYQAAIEAYKKAPTDSAAVWNKMGIAYQMMFNMSDASRCYRESLKLDPKDANVLNNMGTIYDSQKDFKSAVRMYHKALKVDPKSALVLKNLGTDLMAQHNYKRGWQAYKDALAIDPQIFGATTSPRVENPASLQQRGAMNFYMAKGCVRAGMNDRAIEYLRMALNEGFTSPKKIAEDNEFAVLRGIPAFKELIAEQKNP